MPTSKQITRRRAYLNEKISTNAPAESPAEYAQFRDANIRPSNPEPWQMWTLPDFSVISDEATILPFTCDHMLNAGAKFINAGISLQNGQGLKVVRLAGDATHDESHQKLKKFVLGLPGTHFKDGEWRNTLIPLMYCICHEECTEAVDMAAKALIHALQQFVLRQ